MRDITSHIDNIVYIKLITTGDSDTLDMDDMKRWERIVEIYAVKYKDGIRSEYRKIVNPRKSISIELIDEICYLSQNKLENSPTIKEVFPSIIDFIEDLDLIFFDYLNQGKFLDVYGNVLGYNLKNKILSLTELVAIVNTALNDYSFETLKHEYIIDEEDNLRDDYIVEYVDTMINITNNVLEDLWLESSMFLPQEFSDLEAWGWHKYIHPQMIHINEKRYKKKDRVPIIPVDYNKYEELFRDEALWRRTGRGYTIRNQQIEVSKKTREMFQNKNITLIEAPTGIGKSLSYLLPSVIYSYKTGEKVVISTNTKGLQTQLIKKDIPNLLDVLSLNGHIKYISMKGKNNYLCMDKFKLLNKPVLLEEMLGYVFLYRYIFKDKKGDIEEINEVIRKRFFIDKLLEESTCDSEYCDIKSCEYKEQCYYAHEVEKLKEANVIIVNHSLLLKWPYKTDVEIKNLVVDEAHNLKKEVYSAFESEITSRGILKNIKDIYNGDHKTGYLYYLGRKYNDIYDARNLDKKITDISIEIQNVTDRFESYIMNKHQNNEYIYDVNECINLDDKRFDGVKASIFNLLDSISSFNIDINKSFEKLQCNESLKDDKRMKILTEKIKNMDSIKDIIESCMKQQMSDYCYSYGVHKNFKWWGIKYTPLNVAEEFYTKVVDSLSSGLFISATLTSNENYEDIKKTLGLYKCKENNKNLIEVEPIKPVFDYKNNSVIYAPDISSEPSSIKEFAKESCDFVINIADSIEGNILMLFTSNARLRAFEEVGRQILLSKGFSVIKRKSEINNLKKRVGRYIFLGSRGFFEGVDIPGDSMNCVILDKVPNINGREPLYETLIKRLKKKDEEYFSYYNMINYPIVSIDIKQIYGRLMRSEFDYGSFFILSKFDGFNSNTKKLEKELYNVDVIRADARYISSDLRRRYKVWKSRNLENILNQLKEQLYNKDYEQIKKIISDEYDKRNLLMEEDDEYIKSKIDLILSDRHIRQ